MVDLGQRRVDRDRAPPGVQLGPLGDDECRRSGVGGEVLELRPRPGAISSPARRSENDHVSRGVCGVRPADKTGKSFVTYWPGETRPATSAGSGGGRGIPRDTGLISPSSLPRPDRLALSSIAISLPTVVQLAVPPIAAAGREQGPQDRCGPGRRGRRYTTRPRPLRRPGRRPPSTSQPPRRLRGSPPRRPRPAGRSRAGIGIVSSRNRLAAITRPARGRR